MKITGRNSSKLKDDFASKASDTYINSGKDENELTEDSLKKWGWNSFFENEFEKYKEPGLTAGRIIIETVPDFRIASGTGILNAEISEVFRDKTVNISDYPVIGDWVLFRKKNEEFCIIERILERKSSLSSKAAGKKAEELVIAANIDIIGLVFAINGEKIFTKECMERYLAIAKESGAEPVVILNKTDLASEEEREAAVQTAENCAPEVKTFLISAETGEGLDELLKVFKAGTSAAFTGPSGSGKSTIINYLAGKDFLVTAEQAKEVQTANRRGLFILPSGVLLINSPGLREIQLRAAEDISDETFSDILKIAENCSFEDCSHQEEPGCAVQKALAEGNLDFGRYENYFELMREINYLKTKKRQQAAEEKKEKWKNIAGFMKKKRRR